MCVIYTKSIDLFYRKSKIITKVLKIKLILYNVFTHFFFRPGGVYGGSPSGNYGPSHNHNQYPNGEAFETDVLTGPVPSWVKEGPFKNYDKCKCTERFNCKSPGISYGHCDAGKQYCCYATKKVDQIGEPNPSRPHHSIDNGILVGPDGPYDVPRPGSFGGRPGSFGGRPGIFGSRPGNFGGRPVRPGGFGVGTSSGTYQPNGNRPFHSAQNGILVGPGGPYDKPYGGSPGGFGYGRSAKTDN